MIINLHKTVCVDQFKSRVPGSVKPVNGTKKCEYAGDYLNGNYGMFPSDIEIPKNIASAITDYTDTEINIPKNISNPFEYYQIIPTIYDNIGYCGSGVLYSVPINESMDKWSLYDFEGNERKFLTHTTLVKWYDFFTEYHNGLTIEGVGKFDSYEEYGEYLSEHGMYYNSEEFAKMDAVYFMRGGDTMCNFVMNKCVPMKTVEINGVEETMYLSKVIDLLLWLNERYHLYSGITEDDCRVYADDCCECKEYFKRGGNEFYESYSGLLNTSFSCGAETNTASFTLPIMITNDDSVIGLQRDLSTDWNSDSVVNYGEITKYEGYTYLNTNEESEGYSVDTAHMANLFGNLDPSTWDEETDSYSELPEVERPLKKMCEIEQYSEMFNPGVFTEMIHSKTTSKLETVKDTVSSVDNMGNRIDGISSGMYYEGYDGIIREGDYFDLPYHIGNALLREKISSSVCGNVYEDVYYGNFLARMSFFVRYESGGIQDTFISIPQGGKNEYFNRKAIQDCIDFIEENSDNDDIVMDRNIYSKIQYQVGCHITRRQTSIGGGTTFLQEIFIDNDDFSGMTYIDECVLEKNTIQYCCGGPDDAVMVSCYSMKNVDSAGTANVYTPQTFGEEEYLLKATPYDYSPTFRMEDDFGMAYSYKKRQTLNVDRGYAVAFESILKLTEAHTLESLEENGNGFFNFV